jgi:hypothetical protein
MSNRFFLCCPIVCLFLASITIVHYQRPITNSLNSTSVLLLQYTGNLQTLEGQFRILIKRRPGSKQLSAAGSDLPLADASTPRGHAASPWVLSANASLDGAVIQVSGPSSVLNDAPKKTSTTKPAPTHPGDPNSVPINAATDSFQRIFNSIRDSVIFVKGRKCNALNNFQNVNAFDVVESDPNFLQGSNKLEPGSNAKPLKIDYVLTYVSPRAMPETPFLKRSSERYRDWNELHWSLRSIFQNGQLCLSNGSRKPAQHPASTDPSIFPMKAKQRAELEAKKRAAATDPADACLIGNIYLVVANKRHIPKWLQSILDNGLAPFENRHSLEQLNDNNATVLGYHPKCSTIPDREKAFQSFLAKKLKIIEHHEIFPMPNASAMSPPTKELLQAASAEARRRGEDPAPQATMSGVAHAVPAYSSEPITTVEAYNSNAIDLVLHRIPGLSRHFISVNNDMLLGRKLEMKHVFVEVGDHPTAHGTEEHCAMIPLSYYTETMNTPSDWLEPPNTADTTIGQVEFMKRHTVSLMVAFARKSRQRFNPDGARMSMPPQASMIHEFAHVPMLYDRGIMKAISESEPFSPAVTRVLSTQLHGRGLLDIWVPMWYVNIRRVALLFVSENAQSAAPLLGSRFQGVELLGKTRIDGAVGRAFIPLGTGVFPFKTVLYRHVEYRFVMLSNEDEVSEQPYLLSRRHHDGHELFITFNDDFPGDLNRMDKLDLQYMLYDDSCPGRIVCAMDHLYSRIASFDRAAAVQPGNRRFRRWNSAESNYGPDALRILTYFHKMFCTWERVWLQQPLEW